MKKTIFAALTAVALLASSCSSGLGGLLGGGTSTNTSSTGSILSSVLGGVLGNVLFGGSGLTASSLVGDWNYNTASAAYTNENTLNKAGGAAAVSSLISSLASNYQNIGINKNNTEFNFGANNTYAAKVNGIPFNGTYTFNESTGEIALKSGNQTIKGNVARTNNGIALIFDANQMVNMLQNCGQVTNKAAVEAVGKLARTSDGARVGFELTK